MVQQSWPLLLMTSILGATILGSYVVVFGNVGNAFPLPPAVQTQHRGYFETIYWHGTPRDTTVGIFVLQLAAAAGFLTWFGWLVTAETLEGPLRHAWVRASLLGGFLVSSIAWPYAAHAHVVSPTVGRAVGVSACLWVAALAVLLMVAVTFEARAPAAPTVGVLLLGNVVVLADGVGWTANVLRNAIYDVGPLASS